MGDASEAQPTHSARFNSADADVTFRSCDGTVFKVYRKYLEYMTEGFAAPGMSGSDEIIDLPESAATLELLFQYIYPQRQPSLKTIEFEILDALAEAVEKYQVYPALEQCKTFMESAAPRHAYQVFQYAIKHGYEELVKLAFDGAVSTHPLQVLECALTHDLPRESINNAAVASLGCRLSDATSILSSQHQAIWLKFYEKWLDAHRRIQDFDLKPRQWPPYQQWQNSGSRWVEMDVAHIVGIYRRLSAGPGCLTDMDKIFDLSNCASTTKASLEEWMSQAKNIVYKQESFSMLSGKGPDYPPVYCRPEH